MTQLRDQGANAAVTFSAVLFRPSQILVAYGALHAVYYNGLYPQYLFPLL